MSRAGLPKTDDPARVVAPRPVAPRPVAPRPVAKREVAKGDIAKGDVPSRLIASAFALFDERGFERCTVEDIVEHAGVSRTTFFRYFPSKEDVMFPDHDSILERIGVLLNSPQDSPPLTMVFRAARLVLTYYVDEGERARMRFRMASAVPALRDREVTFAHRYQRTFHKFLAARCGPSLFEQIGVELQASAVVTANNHIIRRWLREQTAEPMKELEQATNRIAAMDWGSWTGTERYDPPRTSFVVIETTSALTDLLPRLRSALGE